jgi:hypothetical protein
MATPHTVQKLAPSSFWWLLGQRDIHLTQLSFEKPTPLNQFGIKH